MNAPGRTRLMGMGLLAVTFAAGLLAGAASSRVLAAREAPPAADSTQAPPRRGPHYVFDELDLAPDQRARIDAIMERRRARMDSVWQLHGAPIRAAYDSTRAEIRAVLTPEQAAEYDRLRDERKKRRESEKHGGPAADSARS